MSVKGVEEGVEHLKDMLKAAPNNRVPFDIIILSLIEWMKSHNIKYNDDFIEKVVKYALDSWLVDKVIDYPTFDGDIPLGKLTWFIKFLNENESMHLRGLSAEEQEIIKILRECQTSDELGVIRGEVALQKLKGRGFNIGYIHLIEDKVGDFFSTENDEFVRWYYLIPEYELTDEYKNKIEKRDRNDSKRELLHMESDD